MLISVTLDRASSVGVNIDEIVARTGVDGWGAARARATADAIARVIGVARRPPVGTAVSVMQDYSLSPFISMSTTYIVLNSDL